MNRFLSMKNVIVAGAVLVAATPAFAVIDTTAAVQAITDAGIAVAAVGGAILVLSGISLSYRWVKATFF